MRPDAALIALALTSTLSVTAAAQAGPRFQPSGRATSEVVLTIPAAAVGQPATMRSIKLDYGQPHLRGRALHTDSLVPYDRPWRTGANAATTLTTEVDLVIGGQAVPKGTYVVWTIPARDGGQLVLQRPDSGGTMQQAMRYDTSKDAARIPLTRTTLAAPVESLTMWLIPSTTATAGELRMAWGTTQLSTTWVVR